MLSPRRGYCGAVCMVRFSAVLICLTAFSVSCNSLLADIAAQSLYLGQPTQLMVQPYVTVDVMHEISPGVYESYGPSSEVETLDIFGFLIPVSSPHNSLLLDTGANSILIVNTAAQDLEDAGYQTEDVPFLEVGVAGDQAYDVSYPYRFAFSGSDEVVHYLDGADGTGVRILSDPGSVLAAPIAEGGIAGIVGMPAMSGRVTTIDLSSSGQEFPTGPIETWDLFELAALLAGGTTLDTSFSDNLPADPGNRFTVALDNRIVFSAEDGIPDGEPLDTPVPVYKDVPFLTANATCDPGDGVLRQAEGTFLLDTGAQISMISRRMAFALGLDSDGDGDLDEEAFSTIEITGVGGTPKELPILLIDELRVPTEQGVDIVWYDPSDPDLRLGVQFIVMDLFACADLDFNGVVDAEDIATIVANQGKTVAKGDIPSGDIDGDGYVGAIDLAIAQEQLGESAFIDGVFGVDMLTSGTQLTGEDLDIAVTGTPFFDSVHFDFRNWANGEGTLVFDVGTEHATVTPSLHGDANGDGVVNDIDATIMASNWMATGASWAQGDFNGDGTVDSSDAAMLSENWLRSIVDPPVGDANGDGVVDEQDAAVLAENWLSNSAGWSQGDFNGDGVVNDIDATMMAANWHYGYVGASVPEPNAAMLLSLLAFAAIAAGRRWLG